MLFSYTLLFAILTAFVAAAPTQTPHSTGELPVDGLLLSKASKYVTGKSWTRLPSPNLAGVEPEYKADPMIIFFKMFSRSGLKVYSRLSIGMITSDRVAVLESMKLETAVGDPKALQTGHDGYKDLAKGLIGYWYQTGTNRKVKITRENEKYHISPLLEADLANEMSIAKPEGEVKLTDRMATYYLAAAGGTWTRDNSGDGNRKTEQGSNPVKDLFFESVLKPQRKGHYLDALLVQEDGTPGKATDVNILFHDTEHGLIGVWRLDPKVPSVKPEIIEIKYQFGALYMKVLPQIAPKA